METKKGKQDGQLIYRLSERTGKKSAAVGDFHSSPSVLHGCILDTVYLEQQGSIKVNFLSLTKNKIPKSSIARGFQENTSF